MGRYFLAGFEKIETLALTPTSNTRPIIWRGQIRASAGVAAGLSEEKADVFDHALGKILEEHFPEQLMPLPQRVWALICRKPY